MLSDILINGNHPCFQCWAGHPNATLVQLSDIYSWHPKSHAGRARMIREHPCPCFLCWSCSSLKSTQGGLLTNALLEPAHTSSLKLTARFPGTPGRNSYLFVNVTLACVKMNCGTVIYTMGTGRFYTSALVVKHLLALPRLLSSTWGSIDNSRLELICSLCFLRQISHCSPGQAGTHDIAKADLKFIRPPPPPHTPEPSKHPSFRY